MTQLKICGVTRSEDLALCDELGVDAVGINLWSGSKRGLDPDAAAAMLRGHGGGPHRVGVFVDEAPASVAALAQQLGLDAIQPHGDADIAPYAALGLPYVWVIRGCPDLGALRVPAPDPQWVLLDADHAAYGGVGRRTDWDWAAQAVRHLAPLPVWLAGGIDPASAQEAITAVTPAGLDVASGAELGGGAQPGAKDRAKVAMLVRTCHAR